MDNLENQAKKLRFGGDEIIVEQVYQYRYDFGKGKQVLRILASEKDVTFAELKKLDGYTGSIDYFEGEKKCSYDGYYANFSCNYENGMYNVELCRADDAELAVRKLEQELLKQEEINAALQSEVTATQMALIELFEKGMGV